MAHTQSIVHYAEYLEEKAGVYRELQFDFVRKSSASAKRLVADVGADHVLKDLAAIMRLFAAGFKAKVRPMTNQKKARHSTKRGRSLP